MMEIFVFLQMGGERKRMVIKPLDQLERASRALDLYEKLAHFDAAKAQCFKVEDREKLLAVIEAAFGDFREFNKIVRAAFAQRLDEHRISRPESFYLSSRRSFGHCKVGVEETWVQTFP